jgi:hypothetical protein
MPLGERLDVLRRKAIVWYLNLRWKLRRKGRIVYVVVRADPDRFIPDPRWPEAKQWICIDVQVIGVFSALEKARVVGLRPNHYVGAQRLDSDYGRSWPACAHVMKDHAGGAIQ